ncbi:RIP metalloprotease RseP [Amaricoccus sp.]|uniref:RIP metalloprotease RseP n=1 Tax=Amaricoccus sp. TaxID=1872485 RepID=UPI00331553A0
MDLIAGIPFFGGFLSTVLPFLAVLGIVVAVHEYGHYIVARWCGIQAEVFSIGFGPVVWSRRDRRGTLWQLAALPLGGYVRFLGDGDGASRADQVALDRLAPADRARSFHGATVGRRMLTVLAGPFANFLLTLVVFTGLALWQGIPSNRPTIGAIAPLPGVAQPLAVGDVILTVNGEAIDRFDGFYRLAGALPKPGPLTLEIERNGDRVTLDAPYPFPPLVDGVEPLSPASAVGLRRGDVILEADGKPLASFGELRQVVVDSGGRPIPLRVWRDGAEIGLEIQPIERDTDNGQGGFERRVMIGVAGAPLYLPLFETPAPWTAAAYGVSRVTEVITQSLRGMRSILNGSIGTENLQGPIGIAQISGETASQGLTSFIVLIGVISTAIGLLNLFPIPVLDGGHFVAFLIEAVRGRPPSQAAMQLAMSIGLGLILLLMVFATYNDIMRMVS